MRGFHLHLRGLESAHGSSFLLSHRTEDGAASQSASFCRCCRLSCCAWHQCLGITEDHKGVANNSLFQNHRSALILKRERHTFGVLLQQAKAGARDMGKVLFRPVTLPTVIPFSPQMPRLTTLRMAWNPSLHQFSSPGSPQVHPPVAGVCATPTLTHRNTHAHGDVARGRRGKGRPSGARDGSRGSRRPCRRW